MARPRWSANGSRGVNYQSGYTQWLGEAWEAVVVEEDLQELKAELKERYFLRSVTINGAYHKWLREDRSESPGAFVKRLKATVPAGESHRIDDVFAPVLLNPSDDTYFHAMDRFMNTYVSADEWYTRITSGK